MSNVPEAPSAERADLIGLGGWLTFFGIGAIATPVVVISEMYGSFSRLDVSEWKQIAQSPDAIRTGLAIVALIGVGYGLLAAWSIRIAVLFFQRRRRFVNEWQCSALVYLSLGAFGMLLDYQSGDATQFSRDVLGIAIWTAYLRRSIRVRQTFVR